MIIRNTTKFFPHLMYTQYSVPVGNSNPMCVSLHWAKDEMGKNFDLTKQVLDFPQCSATVGEKMIWNTDDPTTGIDVPVWSQHVADIDCTDEEDCRSVCRERNAVFLNAKRGKKCYSYKILRRICIKVAWDKTLEEFRFKGGCFEGGLHYQMVESERQKLYEFKNIYIEVRNEKDPVLKAGELSEGTYSFGASFVSLFISRKAYRYF